MFELLNNQKINIDVFRADAGSYVYNVLKIVRKNTNKFYIRARMSQRLATAIKDIKTWKTVKLAKETVLRGEVEFTPFVRAARKDIARGIKLEKCRLVVTKTKRKDKQVNLFTDEAYIYSAIITNEFKKSIDQIVHFYNQRGAIEKEFDVLKNDFGWNNLPFSKLEQNTVFMIFSAMGRNLYHYIINLFSKKFKNLKPNYRIKKFIFRFIAIPAKWVKSAREFKLRVYGDLHFKT